MNPESTALVAPDVSPQLRHILVPFDFSEGAKLALEHAIGFARQFDARITLLHIVHLPYFGSGFGPGDAASITARLESDASQQLDALAAEVKRQGVPAEALVRIGHPASDAVDVAQREGVALIVMGTHGRTGLKHVLLGSVAEHVVRHAPCPVLVIRSSRSTSA